MKQSALKKLVEAAANKAKQNAIAMAGSDNPQIMIAHHDAMATHEALSAVLEAIGGNTVYLNILAG